MKKQGILNRDLAALFAQMGHTDCLMIADCGLPIPEGVRCVDLSLKIGEPSFLSVLNTVLTDFEVEKSYIATEMKTNNTALYETMQSYTFVQEEMSHEALKQLSKQVKVIIRTGEATPYANIILQSGVIF